MDYRYMQEITQTKSDFTSHMVLRIYWRLSILVGKALSNKASVPYVVVMASLLRNRIVNYHAWHCILSRYGFQTLVQARDKEEDDYGTSVLRVYPPAGNIVWAIPQRINTIPYLGKPCILGFGHQPTTHIFYVNGLYAIYKVLLKGSVGRF